MYVREIKEKQIFKRIRWQLRIFESGFYKSLIRACSIGNSLAASQNARSDGQTSNHRHCEFVKNALKKCSCLPPEFFQIFVFLLFLSHTCKPTYKLHSCMCRSIICSFMAFLEQFLKAGNCNHKSKCHQK